MSRTLAAVLGGTAGALALVGILVLFVWFCLSHNRSVSRTSETGSSDPSEKVGRNVAIELSSREARRFETEELSLATKSFSDKSLIGKGKFGEVYKPGFKMDACGHQKVTRARVRTLLMR